ncbi:MAG: hypothetical protein ACOYXC_17285 [Candidatus Rifleibacteriota bacterium]
MYDYVKAMFDGRVFPNLTSHEELAKEIKTDEQAVYNAPRGQDIFLKNLRWVLS